MLKSFPRLVLIAGLTGLAALAIWPFHDGVQRWGWALSFLAAWSAGLWYLRRGRVWKVILLVAPMLAAIPFILPGKPIDTDSLRQRYVASMGGMEGTRYLWGGESGWGIDCSGLPRRALRNALWMEGWENGNGGAFREWARQWWFDASARALGQGYRGLTRPLGITGKLADLDTRALAPGDLAVTADGRHVMVYFGNERWIQADPMALKVTLGKAEPAINPWFGSWVSMHRWALLGGRKIGMLLTWPNALPNACGSIG